MVELKAGSHNIPFERISSYNSTFITHWGKFQWLRMPMGLTVGTCPLLVCSWECPSWCMLGDCPLPIVIYLDDIAIYGDTQEQVLEDMLEAIKWLTAASFMVDLHSKSVGPSHGASSLASLDLGWLLSA